MNLNRDSTVISNDFRFTTRRPAGGVCLLEFLWENLRATLKKMTRVVELYQYYPDRKTRSIGKVVGERRDEGPDSVRRPPAKHSAYNRGHRTSDVDMGNTGPQRNA